MGNERKSIRMVTIGSILPVAGRKRIYLASASPRRRALLKDLDIEVEIARTIEVDESYPDDIKAEDVAPYISGKKATAYDGIIDEDSILITADTVVVAGDKVLGKPADRNDAMEMLRTLSGQAHRVITGVTLTTAGKRETFSTVTNVYFDHLTDDEIEYYIDRYSPFDKAGAYGIQEWIGCIGISHIEGCFYNVMGLPLHDLFDHLKKF